MRWFPLIKVDNVFVLPGIPEYVKRVFEERGSLQGGEGAIPVRDLLSLRRICFRKKLEEIQQRWLDRVEIGSYPVTGQGEQQQVKQTNKQTTNL